MKHIQLKDALQCEQAICKNQIEMYKRKKLNNELARKDYQNTLSEIGRASCRERV